MPTLLANPATVAKTHTINHRNFKSWRNADYIYVAIELDEENSRRLDTYHELVERLLTSDDGWTAHKGLIEPDFNANCESYNLKLMRHYYKDGNICELKIDLPVDRHSKKIESMRVFGSSLEYGSKSVFGSGSVIAEVLSLDLEVDELVDIIDTLYVKAATTQDGIYHTTLADIPIDFDLLKETFLLKKIKSTNELVPFKTHKDLRVKHFKQGLKMVVSFTNGKVEHDYTISIPEYQNEVKAKWSRFIKS